MKKTPHITLVLITAALASCHHPDNQWTSANKVYIRSDSTAPYTRVFHPSGAGLWYFVFRPYGAYTAGRYHRLGYYSEAINESSNIGSNGTKGGIVRGGFGEGEAVSS